MRTELRLWIAAGAARSKLAPSASVGKQPKASGAGIARSWLIIEVLTVANCVGFALGSGHSRS